MPGTERTGTDLVLDLIPEIDPVIGQGLALVHVQDLAHVLRGTVCLDPVCKLQLYCPQSNVP